jgi:hypothetical protein
MEMALGSETFIAFAAVVLLNSGTAELRHDHLWRSGAGTLQVTADGLSWIEPGEPKHGRTWAWIDIQQLELTPDTIRVVTYEDSKWRAYKDREYVLSPLPTGFADSVVELLREKLQEKLVAAVVAVAENSIWNVPVKLRQKLGGSEGELVFSPGLLTYRSPERSQSRVWPLDQIEMVSSSGPYDLSVLPHERAGWTGGRRDFRFQLKRPLQELEYQQLWMSIQRANGLILNATSAASESSH